MPVKRPAPLPLPIIFRTSTSRINPETFAVFPTLPHDSDGRYLTCYAQVGQHGSCSHDYTLGTRPSRWGEYRDLLAELRQIYAPEYTLVPVLKRSTTHRNAFRMEVERIAKSRHAQPQG